MWRALRQILFLGLLIVACSANGATEGRVIKVLPQFLDLKGRVALSPSLYDRDAYQAYLRQHPAERSGLRFMVLWKAGVAKGTPLKLRVEMRGDAHGKPSIDKTLEQEVTTGTFRRWTSLTLSGEDFKKLGEITAWRVTLWNGEQLVGEQKSFLW